VYVSQPDGFVDQDNPNHMYKLKKALYGLKQAPRAWYDMLSSFLISQDFSKVDTPMVEKSKLDEDKEGKAVDPSQYRDQTLFIRRQREDFILVQVYVDDIIFGSSNPQLCRAFEALMHEKFQMSAMGELNFFLGLQVLQKEDDIFLSQDKYIGYILKKFGFLDVRSSNTPMDKENPWGKDGTGKDVELHLYRSMIGSLMYLTASRPDIMFAVCACARHQVTPKECHLHAVKRIFRYLKGHPKLGLWYLEASSFDLVAYSDSDYGGASQDRKSTTGGSQFLGRRLISWQCKKQTIVATSTTEAEYVAAASCCGQVLWIQNQLLDYGYNFMNTKIYIDNNSAICIVKNPVYHSKTKHIEIRHHFIRDCFEKKLISVDHIHTDENVADLLTKPFDAGRFQYLVGPANMIARRVTDDVISFSGETAPLKFMKFFLVEKVAESHRFVNRMHNEATTARDCIAQLSVLIAKLQAMKDQKEVHDNAYTYPPLPRVPLSYQASASGLSTLHFLKFPENNVEVLKLLENSVEEYLKDNHREEEDQEGNNWSEIKTLTYHVLATYG
nr:hypothetical protein [Tanacetum cinerariifolium]